VSDPSDQKGAPSPAAQLGDLLQRIRPGGWASILIAATVGGLVAVSATVGIQSLSDRPSASQIPLGGGRVIVSDDTATAAAAQKASPSVVSILAGDSAGTGASGFLVSSNGYIVTNVGVVAGANHLLVLVGGDTRPHDARLVDFDCQVGLAVLKIDQVSNLPALAFGDSSTVQPGQPAVLLGGALPSRSTVTHAVVSAVNRDLTVTNLTPNEGDIQLSGLMETDAQFRPLLNGGPLLSSGGQVVGVLTQATVQEQPASFAIPSNSLQSDVQEIMQTGQLLVPSLGVRSQEVTPDQLAQQGEVMGSKITAVTPGGPADKAGLKVGDVVTKLDDQAINLSNPLPQVLRAKLKIGQRVTVSYSRGGSSNQVQLALVGERPACT
jgi:putative serine protease PepD